MRAVSSAREFRHPARRMPAETPPAPSAPCTRERNSGVSSVAVNTAKSRLSPLQTAFGTLCAALGPVKFPAAGGLLVQIAMHHFRGMSAFGQRLAQRFGHHHRAVFPPRATDGDRQVALSFACVVRNQVREQAFDSSQKLSRLRKRTDEA